MTVVGRLKPPESLLDEGMVVMTYDRALDRVQMILPSGASYDLGGLSGDDVDVTQRFFAERYLTRALGDRPFVAADVIATLMSWRSCVIDVATGRVSCLVEDSVQSREARFAAKVNEHARTVNPDLADGPPAFVYIESVAPSSLLPSRDAPMSRNPKRRYPRG